MIKADKRIFDSGKMCRSYSDLNFGVTFFGTQCRSGKDTLTELKLGDHSAERNM